MKHFICCAFVLPIVLVGCGGGGGGGGGNGGAVLPNSPAPAVVPTASTLPAGVSVSARFSEDGQGGVAIDGYTIDPDFTLTTVGAVGRNGTTGNVSKVTTTGLNTALDGNTRTLTHGSNGEVIENQANAVSGYNDSGLLDLFQTKRIEMVTQVADPVVPGNISGSAGKPFQASYLTMGGWLNCSPLCQQPSTMGFFVFGDATQPNNIPAIGRATYNGLASGSPFDQDYEMYAGGSSSYIWGSSANMKAEANFFLRTIDFSTSDTVVTVTSTHTNLTNVVPTPQLNITGTLSYSGSVNLFSGAVADAGGRTGTATGRFYGPAAEEIGGVYNLGAPESGHTGVFAGIK